MTLPQGWVETRLGNVCELLNGRAYKKPELLTQGKYPVLRVGNFFTSDKWYYSDLELEPEKYCDDGDLLYAWSASFGPRMWTGGKAIYHYHIWRTRLAEEALNKQFLFHWFEWDKENIKSDHGTGTTMIHVTKGDMENRAICLPPLAEQRRIVAKLDALTARLARARAELDRVPVLAQQMRNAILVEVFSAGASTERIDALCMVGTGSTPKRGEARYYVGGTIPWVTSGVVNQRSVFEPTEHVTEAAIKETNCKVFPAGSLLVALYGEGKTRGKVTSLEIAAATNQALAVLHTFDTDRVEPAWIRRFLESRYEMTRSEAAGGVQPNLNLGIVKAIAVPLPPIAEQRQSLVAIDAAFARADRLEAEAVRARALLDRLESALLAKAFRGELVLQDPNDEPAQTLLDRIRSQRAAAPKAKRGRKAKVTA